MSFVEYPFSFAPDTVGNANQVDSNFNAIASVVAGQLDTTNLVSNAGITLSQIGLNPGGLAFNRAAASTLTYASGLTTDMDPRVAFNSNGAILWGAGGGSTPDLELIRTTTNTVQLNNNSGGPANLDLNGGMVLNASLGFTNLNIPGTFTSGSAGTGGSLTLYGSTSGHATIEVNPNAGTTTFNLPTSYGTSGYALITDGAGNLSWANIAGSRVTLGPFALPAVNTSQILSHSLGAIPRRVACLITCVTTDVSGGYSVGNNAYFSLDSNDGLTAFNLTSTQISICTGDQTFVGNRQITNSCWQYTLYLFS